MWSLDVYTGLMSMVQRARSPILDWSTDRNGVVRFGAGHDDSKSPYITRDSAKTQLAHARQVGARRERLRRGRIRPEPGTLLVTAVHNGRDAIFEMDLNEKKSRQLLFANGEVDVGGPIYWPADRRIVGFGYDTDVSRRMVFDEQAKSVFDAIDTVLPNANNRGHGLVRRRQASC